MKLLKSITLFTALTASLAAAQLQLSGSVISDNQKMITSRFMGFVQAFHVSVGDEVKGSAPLRN